MLLIGYIPVATLGWISDEEERRKKKWELFHASMALILESLKEVSRVGEEMRCADGGVRRVYPILAAHIGDWPEQCTVGSTCNTRCPVCVAPFIGRGDLGSAARLRTKFQTLRAIRLDRQGYSRELRDLGVRPVLPYWWDHPWSSGPGSIQPDLLHQLWKGIYTHLFEWWERLLGLDELDERYMGLPRYSGHRHYAEGISAISQWTGNEARGTARSCLAIVAGERTYSIVRATRCVMDFTYRARTPQLDEDDLAELEADLAEFHKHKHVFAAKGAHKSKYGFDGISKLHILRHYTHLIREMGTPDNYSTDGPERLHIDYVKEPYDRTSGVCVEPQMTERLQQLEAWDFLQYELEAKGVIEKKRRRARAEEEPIEEDLADGDSEGEADKVESEGEMDEALGDSMGQNERRSVGVGRGLWVVGARVRADPPIERIKESEACQFDPSLEIARSPTHPKVRGADIIRNHHAVGFIEAVTDYVKQLDPNLAFQINENAYFGIWSRFALHHRHLPFAPLVGRHIDLVRASPARKSRGRVTKHAYFDTVLLEDFPNCDGLLRAYSDSYSIRLFLTFLSRVPCRPGACHLSVATLLPPPFSTATRLRRTI